MELRLNRVPNLQLVLNRRHLQLPIQHCLPIHIVEPRVLLYRLCIFLSPQTFFRVLAEQLLYQVSEHFRRIFGEPYHSPPHQIIKFSFGIRVEGREASIELIKHHPEFIPIRHTIMSLLVDDLQRQVGRGSAEGFVNFVQILLLLAEPEVRYQRVALLIKHDVLGLEVAVEDLVFVEGIDSQQNLAGVVSYVLLLELFALF